jgi:hypothetical protein
MFPGPRAFHYSLLDVGGGRELYFGELDSKLQGMGCKTFAEFTAAGDFTFENIPKEMLKKLAGSMRKRLQLVIDNDGNHRVTLAITKCDY